MPEEAKKRLSPVSDGESFITREGEEIKSLVHLLETLNNTSEENFKHHVNETKNDYRDWVKYSVKDETLALELGKTNDLGKTKEIVKKRIEELNKRIHMGDLIKKINHFNMQNTSSGEKIESNGDVDSKNIDFGSDFDAKTDLADSKIGNKDLSSGSELNGQIPSENSKEEYKNDLPRNSNHFPNQNVSFDEDIESNVHADSNNNLADSKIENKDLSSGSELNGQIPSENSKEEYKDDLPRNSNHFPNQNVSFDEDIESNVHADSNTNLADSKIGNKDLSSGSELNGQIPSENSKEEDYGDFSIEHPWEKDGGGIIFPRGLTTPMPIGLTNEIKGDTSSNSDSSSDSNAQEESNISVSQGNIDQNNDNLKQYPNYSVGSSSKLFPGSENTSLDQDITSEMDSEDLEESSKVSQINTQPSVDYSELGLSGPVHPSSQKDISVQETSDTVSQDDISQNSDSSELSPNGPVDSSSQKFPEQTANIPGDQDVSVGIDSGDSKGPSPVPQDDISQYRDSSELDLDAPADPSPQQFPEQTANSPGNQDVSVDMNSEESKDPSQASQNDISQNNDSSELGLSGPVHPTLEKNNEQIQSESQNPGTQQGIQNEEQKNSQSENPQVTLYNQDRHDKDQQEDGSKLGGFLSRVKSKFLG